MQMTWEMFFCEFYDYLLFTDILFEEAAVKKDVLQLCGLYSDVRRPQLPSHAHHNNFLMKNSFLPPAHRSDGAAQPNMKHKT